MTPIRTSPVRNSRWLVPAAPALWLGLFFLVPFAIVARIALSDAATARPPYRPVLDVSEGWQGVLAFLSGLDLENFATLAADPLYLDALVTSLWVAGLSTLIMLATGYPMALAMARAPHRWRPLLLALVILPFWTSFLIRIYAWIGILKPEGLLNAALIGAGVISEPLQIINTPVAVLIGIAYAYLPFMVLPLYAALDRMGDRFDGMDIRFDGIETRMADGFATVGAGMAQIVTLLEGLDDRDR